MTDPRTSSPNAFALPGPADPAAGPGPVGPLAGHLATVPLVDHHVHGVYRDRIDRATFEQAINEGSPDPVPEWMTQFDSQLGFAIRTHCAPMLDLEPHAAADEYWARREALGPTELTRRFLHAAGVTDWLVDSGYHGDVVLTPEELNAVIGGRTHRLARLETIAEAVLREGVDPSEYAARFRDRLAAEVNRVVGFKTIAAYRTGLELPADPPTPVEVTAAVATAADRTRLTDPVLIRFGIHAAAELGLPLQFHTGFGDRDEDLHRANPILLLDLLRQPTVASTPVMLLHCYPYHREAGYLAQAFGNVYCDIGLSMNHVGARASAVLAELLELAPFAKVLYSSDAWGPPELHYLGAVLWRRSLTAVLGQWVSDGDWSLLDALRVADLIARGNAERVYRLGPTDVSR